VPSVRHRDDPDHRRRGAVCRVREVPVADAASEEAGGSVLDARPSQGCRTPEFSHGAKEFEDAVTDETRRAVARTSVMSQIYNAVEAMNLGNWRRGLLFLDVAGAWAVRNQIDQDPMLDDMRAVGMDVN
jgi:hypothetical protein